MVLYKRYRYRTCQLCKGAFVNHRQSVRYCHECRAKYDGDTRWKLHTGRKQETVFSNTPSRRGITV
jgi:hypothetical protein